MLDEVIEYLKQLQAQVQMMNRMNMQPMMLPMAMQQQLQMSMLAPMSMGMCIPGMGMGVMDIGRHNMTVGISPVLHPTAFMPMTAWDGSGGDRLQAAAPATVMPDPLSAFLACQSQVWFYQNQKLFNWIFFFFDLIIREELVACFKK